MSEVKFKLGGSSFVHYCNIYGELNYDAVHFRLQYGLTPYVGKDDIVEGVKDVAVLFFLGEYFGKEVMQDSWLETHQIFGEGPLRVQHTSYRLTLSYEEVATHMDVEDIVGLLFSVLDTTREAGKLLYEALMEG